MDTVVCVCIGGGKGERVNECVCVQLYVCRWEEGGGASETMHEEWREVSDYLIFRD